MSEFDLTTAPNWAAPALDRFAEARLLFRDAALADVAAFGMSRLCYLATPPAPVDDTADARWGAARLVASGVPAARWACRLSVHGVTALSPMVQAVEMHLADRLASGLPDPDALFWQAWQRPLVAASDFVAVPPIVGWQDCAAVWGATRHALETRKPVFLISDVGGV